MANLKEGCMEGAHIWVSMGGIKKRCLASCFTFTRNNLAAEQNGIVVRFNVIQTCHQLINILVFNFISNMFLHHKVESLLFEERYFCAVIDRNGF